MPTIARIRRKNGVSYKAKIMRRGRVIKSKTFRSKTAAREWARRADADVELAAALNDPGMRIRFGELCDRYVAAWQGADHLRMSQIKWWRVRLSARRLAEIEVDEIRSWLGQYRNGLDREPCRARSPASANRMKAALSAMFTYAQKQGLASANPARLIPSETERNQRVRYLSEEERMRLLVACRNSTWDRLYLLVLMAIMTGARKGELRDVRWEQIDFAKRRVLLHRTKIAEVLGHRSLQTTKRYAHLSVEHRQNLTDRLLGDLELRK